MAKAKKTKRPTISEQLRAAIVSSGLSTNALAKECKISQPTLHRFVMAEYDMRSSGLDRLATYFDLHLVPRAKKK
jgi:ribosome-binding protein aMBF1 (putative translation factor)